MEQEEREVECVAAAMQEKQELWKRHGIMYSEFRATGEYSILVGISDT